MAAEILGDPNPSMPPPLGRHSIVRRVAAEPVTALLVQRALVMEVAHPKVAAGVADHSSFRRRPLSRAWVTADAALRLVFGDAATARGAVEQIYRTHDRINGNVVPGAEPYTAHDATLLRWVWATLVDTAATAWTRWVRPFTPEEGRAFYDDMLGMGRFLGIPTGLLPPDRGAFDEYLESVLAGPELGSTAASREMARQVLWFRHPLVPPPVVNLERALALATLDPRVLERLEIRVTPADARLGRRVDELLRTHYRRLPRWRTTPAPVYLALRRPTIGLARRVRSLTRAA